LALACGHFFHEACIEQWLQHQAACPHDRYPVAPDSEGRDTNSDNTAVTVGESFIDESDGVAEEEASQLFIDTLTMHLRLVAELEIIRARATDRIAAQMEVEIETQWAEFLQLQIHNHRRSVELLEDAILGPERGVPGE
jgi:hypothetical protein